MMKELKNKTALVTGGASGIGLALARASLARGMNVVIADIEQAALDKAVEELDGGDRLLALLTDVGDSTQMEALSRQTQETFGSVHLLFNNAGVGGGGPIWEQSEEDWRWLLGVNLWGVIHGIRLFTPGMIAQGEGHIVNTASIAGLISAPDTGTYTVSKHAVVALSEVLYGDLRNADAGVGVSVLCPSFVNTRIHDYQRNRPDVTEVELSDEQLAEQQAIAAATVEFFDTAQSPDDVAEQVFEAIGKEEFYILTHPKGSGELVEKRLGEIVANRNPSLTGPEAFPLD
jgi:NAD(P)-dependent dehydrogenase (short-subunit alcohol dehydrogenase family)